MALDQKLNFDTPPEETISADPDCSICLGRGTMTIRAEFNTYSGKECACITRKRERLARKKHRAIYKPLKNKPISGKPIHLDIQGNEE